MQIPKLNLPEGEFRITEKLGTKYIWDDIRKKDIILTQEEWVRQNFIHLLVNHLHYPRSLIKVETGLAYYKKQKRSDIEVIKRDGSVFLLVECKSPDVKIDQRSLIQISVYNKSLGADYIALTNGLKHYFWAFVEGRYHSLDRAPVYPK